MIAKIIFQRLIATFFVLIGISTLTFLLLRLTPGDPVELMMKDFGTEREAQSLRHELGLDKSFSQQYFSFFSNLVHGDLGINYLNKRKVADEIRSHLPATLLLALSAMIFAIGVGIPLGVIAGYKKYTWIDNFLSGAVLFGLSIPSFWLGPVLIIFFSIKLNWLPVSGREDGFLSFLLPTLSLGISISAVLQRITRAAILEVLNEEYINVARSKGLKERVVIFKHALKNALIPVITITGLQIGALATGVVITETIFDWPGLGVLLYSGLRSRNYPVVQGCILCIGVIYVLVNLLTDITCIFINPRLREA